MGQIIDAAEVVTLPRGRKAEPLRPELVKLFKSLKPSQAAVLSDEFDPATDTNAKQKVRSQITRHWTGAGRTEPVKVEFTPDGIAQARVNVKKMERDAAAAATAS